MKLRLFEYAVLLHPETKKEEKNKTILVKQPAWLLAKDEKQVGMLAAREVPEKYLDQLDRVEIIVRPF